MPRILSSSELREALTYSYSKDVLTESRTKRLKNIISFNNIPRDGLCFNSIERQLILHESQHGEEISIQFPGKESNQREPMPFDFRPKVRLANGEMMEDFTFGQIWDIFEIIGNKYRDFLSYVSAIVYDMGYMHKYKLVESSYQYKDIYIDEGGFEKVKDTGFISLEWYQLSFSEDVWHTLDDKIGLIELATGETVSLEAFLFMVDLLFQNEDCKYYYRKAILGRDTTYKNKLNNGRNSSSHSNLFMLNYLQGNEKVSALVNAFVKGRGVAGYKKQDYSVVTNGMVFQITTEDEEN